MGLIPSEFWKMTPFSFGLLATGFNKLKRNEFEQTAWLARTTALLMRAKKIPKLKDMIGTKQIVGIDEDQLRKNFDAYNNRIKK